MTMFINQLNQDVQHANGLSKFIGIRSLKSLNADDIRSYEKDAFVGFAEGYIYVDVEWVTIGGKPFPKTTPTSLVYRKTGEKTDTLVTPDTIQS